MEDRVDLEGVQKFQMASSSSNCFCQGVDVVMFIDCLIEQEGKAKERRKRRRRKEEKKWEKWGSYRESQSLMSQHGTCQITHAGSSMRAQETFQKFFNVRVVSSRCARSVLHMRAEESA